MIKMEESKEPLDFGVRHKRFCAYRCFGDKATEYLSCLKQPYEDISNCNNNLDSEQYFAIFVFTDNAEVYTSEIDTFIKRYKDFTDSIFILDLHSNLQYETFRERWGFYNIILSSSYCTLQKSILHYLLFFHHFIETLGLISMDLWDFKFWEQLTERVLHEARVFIAPGFIFGSNGRRYVRISLCAKDELMMKARDRIASLEW